MKRVRVAHVITRLCKGGAQENTFHTARLANRGRYDVDLIAGALEPGESSIEDAVRGAGIELIHIPHLVRNPSPTQDWRAYQELLRLFRERRYDIVHTHTSKAGYVGRLAAAKAGVPVIVHTPHGHIFFGYFNAALTAFFTMLEQHAARKTDRLIALTERGIREHLAQGVGRPEQWVSIFSGIDLKPYADAQANREETRKLLGITTKDILIGGVGRLEPVKGFAYFVRAAHTIAKALPEARFVLIGDGALRGQLEADAAALGSRIQFLGMRHDVPALMAAMDICVVPSLNEGMGRVILEAGAARTPVVASRIGGIPEVVVDGETGVLIPPRDVDALANAAIALARDPVRRQVMGGAAAERACAYSLEHMVERIEALYETLIGEKHLDA